MGESRDFNDADAANEPGEYEAEFEQGSELDNEPQDGEATSAPADEELARMRDALLRTRAEMDNLQKRSERELERSRKFMLESLLRDLVPVVDSLDQGLENAAGHDEQLTAGLELTRKQLLKVLTQYGLEVLDPEGETFDPQWHEAMSMQPSSDHEPDTVMNVLQKGYRLHERLLRPARVIVARATDD